MGLSDRTISRRRFVRMGFLGAIAWTAAACGILPAGDELVATPTDSDPAIPLAVTPTQAMKILRNEDREGFYIRYYKPFPALDVSKWQLVVAGLVRSPRSYSLEDLLTLPQVSLDARMKCVECWSVRARWSGFHYDVLAAQVGPLDEARYVRFDCADDYWEIIPVEDLRNPRALFVTHLNGELLPDEYGAPLRLLFPWKYAYKSAKVITKITFSQTGGPGYWSAVGPYSMDGDIQAGLDRPLDLEGVSARRIIGGEIQDY